MRKILLLPALFTAGMIHAQTVGATWEDTSPSSAASPPALEGGIAVTVDASGNVFTVGTFTSATTVGSVNLTATGGNGDRDVYVAKYDASGNFVHAIKLGTPGLDDGFSIAWKADGSGNGHVFVTGYFRETAWPLVPTGRIYKLDDDGTPLTIEITRDLGTDVRARSIYSYGTDRLMVGGSFFFDAYLPQTGGGAINLNASNQSSASCPSGCYDSFTGIIDMSAYFLYAGNPYSSTKDNEIMAIHCRNGYIYTTGYFKGDLQWKSTSTTMTAAGVQDAFVASVYMSGSLNQCTFNTDQMQAGSIESQPAGAAGLLPDWKECGYGIVANGTAIYVTGNLNNASTPLFDGGAYSGAGAFVTRINYSGSQLGSVSWVRASKDCSSGSAVTKSIGYGIVCDDLGDVWATGAAYSDVRMAGGSNSDLCVGGSGRPGFICRYNSTGDIQLMDQINQSATGTLRTEGKSIAASGCKMVTTGWDGSSFTFQAGALPIIGVTGTACSSYIFGFNREATISNSIYICTTCGSFPLTGSINVSARGATGYSWSPTTYLTNYNTATPSYSVTACTGTVTTYYATVTSSVCPTAVIPFTFATVVQSAANAGPDIAVCPGVPEVFGTAAVFGYSYNWSPVTNLGGTYNQAQPTYSNTTTLSSPRVYMVTATDWCGNVTVDYVTLSNDPGCRIANPDGVTQMADIFPNPSTGTFTVNLPMYENEADVELTVTDLTGRTVQQNTVTTTGGPVAVDLSGEPKGVYLLSVIRNGQKEVHQLVVE